MTAAQNIERGKGAATERRWFVAEIRRILKLYPKDLVLNTLLDIVVERQKAEL